MISWRASSAGSPQSLQSAGFFSHAAGPEDQRPLLGSDATQPIALQRIRHHAETAADYQRLLVLLEDWEHESARIILGADRLTPRNRKR